MSYQKESIESQHSIFSPLHSDSVTTLSSSKDSITTSSHHDEEKINQGVQAEVPEWVDKYINAHRIAEENHEYMRTWLTKIPLCDLLQKIQVDYIGNMGALRTEHNRTHIQNLVDFAINEHDPRYLVYAYTAATPFFEQLNKDLAQRGSDFRFENRFSARYRDDEPPGELGQYLFAAILIHHPLLECFRQIPLTTYRGMNLRQCDLDSYVKNACILTRSFLSTSTQKNVPGIYLGFNDPTRRPVLFRYRIKQARTCLKLGELSAFPEEEEVLIVPFAAFVVEKVEYDSVHYEGRGKATQVFLEEIATKGINRCITDSDMEKILTLSDNIDITNQVPSKKKSLKPIWQVTLRRIDNIKQNLASIHTMFETYGSPDCFRPLRDSFSRMNAILTNPDIINDTKEVMWPPRLLRQITRILEISQVTFTEFFKLNVRNNEAERKYWLGQRQAALVRIEKELKRHEEHLIVGLNAENQTENEHLLERLDYEEVLWKRAQKQERIVRKSIDTLNEQFSSTLSNYIVQCMTNHAYVRNSGHLHNTRGTLIVKLFGQKVGRSSKDKEKWQTILGNLSIPIHNIAHRVILNRSFSVPKHSETLNEISTSLLMSDQMDFQTETEVDFIDVLQEKRWIVLLGVPGSGKTTFARLLTLLCAKAFVNKCASIENSRTGQIIGPVRLPILVAANQLAKILELDTSLSLFECISQSISLNDWGTSGVEKEFIREYIRNGHALIILDGLDEIYDAHRRQHIVTLIRQFLNQFVLSPTFFVSPFDFFGSAILLTDDHPIQVGGNQVIITSRIIGYNSYALTGYSITTYQLTPLSSKSIDLFIDHWFLNVYSQLTEDIVKLRKSLKVSNMKRLWQQRAKELRKEINNPEGSLQKIASIPLFLSVICTLSLQISNIKLLPKNRIRLYHGIIDSIIRKWCTRNQLQISEDILRFLLSEIATYMTQYLPTGIIEEFDVVGKCRISLAENRVHQHLSSSHDTNMDDNLLIRDFIRIVSEDVGLFAPRGICTLSFLHLTFQEYFTCLYLVKQDANSNTNIVLRRFFFHLTDIRFREPLLLALAWLSWKWPFEQFDTFCQELIRGENDDSVSCLPLGAILLITAITDLDRLPSKKTIFSAFNQYMNASHNNDWFSVFPIFIQQFLDGLNNLPVGVAAQWLHQYLRSVDIRKTQSICRIFIDFIRNTGVIPSWIDRTVCMIISQRTQDKNDCTIDRLLSLIESFKHDLLPSFSDELREYMITHKLSVFDIHPLLLSVIIILYGGLYRRADSTVEFSPVYMHRTSCLSSQLIQCLKTNKQRSITHLRKYCKNKILRTDFHDTSSDVVDIIITWLCLRGLGPPGPVLPFVSRPAFSLAESRLKHSIIYMRDFYFFDNETVSPTVMNDAQSVIRLYMGCLNSSKSGSRKSSSKNVNKLSMTKRATKLILFVRAVVISLARLTQANLSVFEFRRRSECEMLNLELPKDFQYSSFIVALGNSQSTAEEIESLAILIRLICCPFDPYELTEYEPNANKYQEIQHAQVRNGTHPALQYRHYSAFIFAFLSPPLNPLYIRLFITGFHEQYSCLPFVHLLVEVLQQFPQPEKNPLTYALFLAILRPKYELWNLRDFLAATICELESEEIINYFYEFDRLLSDNDRRPCFSPQIQDKVKRSHWLTETLTNTRPLLKLKETSSNLRNEHDDSISTQYYVSIVTLMVLCECLFSERNWPLYLTNEIVSAALHIDNSSLKMHILSILNKTIPELDSEQSELIEGAFNNIVREAMVKAPLELLTLLLLEYHFICPETGFDKIYTLENLFDRLKRGKETDSIETQQAVCSAVSCCADKVPFITTNIHQFAQKSKWSKTNALSRILRLKSVPFNHFFDKYLSKTSLSNSFLSNIERSSTVLLLPMLYLMALSVNVCSLSDWIEPEDTDECSSEPNKEALGLECIELLKSGGSILTGDVAERINNIILNVTTNDTDLLLRIERALRVCTSIDNYCVDTIEEWFSFTHDTLRQPFAYHAARMRTKPIVQSCKAVALCCQLLQCSIDYFRVVAEISLDTVLELSVLVPPNELMDWLCIFTKCPIDSTRTYEVMRKINIQIQTVDHLHRILVYERNRIRCSLMDTDQNCTETSHQASLLNFKLEMWTPEVQTAFVDHLCAVLVSDSSDQSEQQYISDLFYYVARHWREEKYSWELTEEKRLVNCCNTILNANNNSQDLLILEAAIFALGFCEVCHEATEILERFIMTKATSSHLSDDIIVAVVDSYCVGTREEVSSEIEHCFNKLRTARESSVAVVTAASAGIIELKWYYNNCISCDDLLDVFENRYIDLYEALFRLTYDTRQTIYAQDALTELIVTKSEFLLSKFINDLYCEIHVFDIKVLHELDKDQYLQSTHLQVAVRVAEKISTSFYTAVKDNESVGEKQFKQAIYATSKQLNQERRIVCLQLLSIHGDLTLELVDMFLYIAWEQPSTVQIRAYKYIANIRRTQNRNVVDRLISTAKTDKSLQRRYVAAMLLTQLARCDQVSIREVRQELSYIVDDASSKLGDVYVSPVSYRDNNDGSTRLDKAIFSLLVQLSFISDNIHESLSSFIENRLFENEFNVEQEFDKTLRAGEYTTCSFDKTATIEDK